MIIIGGGFSTYDGTGRNHIARLNATGSLDTGFDPGTGTNSTVHCAAIQSDGKIICGGDFTTCNGIERDHIARLNADGSLDTGFNPGTGTNGTVYSIMIQADGKVLIGGDFTTCDGIGRDHIARLNTNGSLDIDFDPGTGANDAIYSIAVQSDGKILIGGAFTEYNGVGRGSIARLSGDGSLDTGFDPGTGANNVVRSIALQSDGQILIGGSFTTYNGADHGRITRLNVDGSLDSDFNLGAGANGMIYSIAVQDDGQVLIGGDLTNYNFVGRNRIARLNMDGTLDTGFDPGTGANSTVYSAAVQADGKVVIGGYFSAYDGTERHDVARLNADGSLDPLFDPATGANNSIYVASIQSDGKILVGGYFTSYNGTGRKRIARLDEDGSLDNSFNPGTGTDDRVWSIATQADGKVIIGGEFSSYAGIDRNRIARLNADGSLDTGFDPGTGITTGSVQSISIQSNGKIIIGGAFLSFNGTVSGHIARLNTDGSLDTSFDPGTGAEGIVFSTALQSDGKILIGGAFNSYNGVARKNIARLNTDGSLDISFDPGTGATAPSNQGIASVAVQSDGKILIGGLFTAYNGIERNRIARVNADGSLDISFDPGTGVDDAVQSVAVQADGGVLIAGFFTACNGISRNRIARLNVDGSLDANFDPGIGANDAIRSIAVQADLQIIVAGDFTAYNGTGRNRIARIISDLSVGVEGKIPSDTSALHLWPNPNDGDHIHLTLDGLDRSLCNVGVTLFDALGRQVFAMTEPVTSGSLKTTLDLDHAADGVYLLRIIAGDETFSQRMVVR